MDLNLSTMRLVGIDGVHLKSLSINGNEIWRIRNEIEYATDSDRSSIYNDIGYKANKVILSDGEERTASISKIHFNNPEGFDTGVVLENPFIGKDTSNGAYLTFWLTPSENISGISYDYTSMITAVSEDGQQEIKFDLEGTRQLSTINGPDLNYWEAETNLQLGQEYFITLVIGKNGLDYYVNGNSLGYTNLSQTSYGNEAEAAMSLISAKGTKLYAGGTSSVDSSMQSITSHDLPENTIIRDIRGYLGEVDATKALELYENSLKQDGSNIGSESILDEYRIGVEEFTEVAEVETISESSIYTCGFISVRSGQTIFIEGVSHSTYWNEYIVTYDANNMMISCFDINNYRYNDDETKIKIYLDSSFGTDFDAIRFSLGNIDENTNVYVI